MDEAKTKKHIHEFILKTKNEQGPGTKVCCCCCCLFYLILKSNREKFLQTVIFCGTLVWLWGIILTQIYHMYLYLIEQLFWVTLHCDSNTYVYRPHLLIMFLKKSPFKLTIAVSVVSQNVRHINQLYTLKNCHHSRSTCNAMSHLQ